MMRCLGVLALMLLASCDGGRALCCGYATSEDWTSEVSITRDGIVALSDVSAIIEERNRYIVETRPIDEKAPRLKFKHCDYSALDKQTGEWSRATKSAAALSLVDGALLLRTDFSCLNGSEKA